MFPRLSVFLIAVALVCAGCQPGGSSSRPTASSTQSLQEARKGFQTKLARRESASVPVPEPPADVFRLVHYDSPVGKLAAYLTPDPGDGKKHPAIVWISGGDCNTIGDFWSPAPASNDQTAAAYRHAGVLMMFPSLRGGNDNPGVREGFLGEVDDVLAAAEFLAQQSYVDPQRIYLGGHSTGGTLVLLVAECSDRFRAVFSFGPVSNPTYYPPVFTPFRTNDAEEVALRSPVRWLSSIKSPTLIFEGSIQGNTADLEELRRASRNPQVTCYEVSACSHFSLLAPLNRMLAEKILRDTGPTVNLHVSADEIRRAVAR